MSQRSRFRHGSAAVLILIIALAAASVAPAAPTREDAKAATPATETASPPRVEVAQAPRPPAPARGAAPPGGGPTTRLAADLHLNQGMTYAAMKDWDNAINEFSKAVDIDGRYAAAYANRAVAYMQQRKYNKALDDLKQAESISPDDKMIHYNYVALYSLQNQLDRALDSLDRALDRGFNNYDALRNDPDLNNVRTHPDFRTVLEKHKVFIR
jgi:tetratricopeptide (TPR) repeat protein